MNVTVDAEGRVIETEIVRALAVEGARPARRRDRRARPRRSGVHAGMRQQADQLVITSRFKFTRDDGLETTVSAALRI